MVSLANNVQADIISRIDVFTDKSPSDFQCEEPITLTVPIKGYHLSQRERRSMETWGTTSFEDLQTFKVVRALGVHFRTGGVGSTPLWLGDNYNLPGCLTVLCRECIFDGD